MQDLCNERYQLPEPSAEGGAAGRGSVAEPTKEDRELAAAMASGIEDESLRKVVAKAAAASLARPS